MVLASSEEDGGLGMAENEIVTGGGRITIRKAAIGRAMRIRHAVMTERMRNSSSETSWTEAEDAKRCDSHRQ